MRRTLKEKASENPAASNGPRFTPLAATGTATSFGFHDSLGVQELRAKVGRYPNFSSSTSSSILVTLVLIIIAVGCRIDLTNKRLHSAAAEGDLVAVNGLLAGGWFRSPQAVNDGDTNGLAPLHHACLGGHAAVAELLLSHGADIEAKLMPSGLTLLQDLASKKCASDGQVAVMEVLFSHGADVNAKTKDSDATVGATPLHLATVNGCVVVMEFLLTHGADVNAKDATAGATPLHFAAMIGHAKAAELLLLHGADVHAMTNQMLTPFRLAQIQVIRNAADNQPTVQGHIAVIEMLAFNGTDVDVNDREGLMRRFRDFAEGEPELDAELKAIEKRNEKLSLALDTVNTLNARIQEVEELRGGMDPAAVADAKHRARQEKLQLAVDKWQNETDMGATEQSLFAIEDLLAAEDTARRLLQAAQDNDLAAAKLLLAAGAVINDKGVVGAAPLHVAAESGHAAMAELLLSQGADVNLTDDMRGETPLHHAASAGQAVVAELLLLHSADVHAKDKFGSSPLHSAATEGHTAVITLLLSHGADVNAKSLMAIAPLHAAAALGHATAVELLLSHGADLHATATDLEATPLHLAAQQGHAAVVEVLLSHDADINKKAFVGVTPLHVAAQQGHAAVVTLLILRGADVNAKNVIGQTPRDQWAEDKAAFDAAVNAAQKMTIRPFWHFFKSS